MIKQRTLIIIFTVLNIKSPCSLAPGTSAEVLSPSPAGYFGVFCNLKCPGECEESDCVHVFGNCYICNKNKSKLACATKEDKKLLTQDRLIHIQKRSKKGCSDGCKKCDSGECKSCKNNYYGDDCSQRCGKTCNGCHRKNGKCTACKPGWYIVRKCNQKCPLNCKKEKGCEIRNGRCVECEPGWHGDCCEKECGFGFYGKNCKSPCPDNCLLCYSKENCTICRNNWKGPTCQEQVVALQSSSDGRTVVVAVVTVVVIVVVALLVAAAVFFYRKRRHFLRYEAPIQQEDSSLRYLPSVRRCDEAATEFRQVQEGYIRPGSRYINIKNKNKQPVDYRTGTSDDEMEAENLLGNEGKEYRISVQEEHSKYPSRDEEPIYADIDETLMCSDDEFGSSYMDPVTARDSVQNSGLNTEPNKENGVRLDSDQNDTSGTNRDTMNTTKQETDKYTEPDGKDVVPAESDKNDTSGIKPDTTINAKQEIDKNTEPEGKDVILSDIKHDTTSNSHSDTVSNKRPKTTVDIVQDNSKPNSIDTLELDMDKDVTSTTKSDTSSNKAAEVAVVTINQVIGINTQHKKTDPVGSGMDQKKSSEIKPDAASVEVMDKVENTENPSSAVVQEKVSDTETAKESNAGVNNISELKSNTGADTLGGEVSCKIQEEDTEASKESQC